MISIAANGRSVEMPVLIVPGQTNESIIVALGYGRAFNGRIAAGAGVDVYPLRTTNTMGFVPAATVARASGTHRLAMTQDHHAIEPNTTGGKGIQQRLPTLIREATLKEYRDDPRFARHRVHVTHRLSLFEEDKSFHADGAHGARYAWGMTIDLNSCVGCSACVIACQAENNIPIVGRDQVLRGREMHWLRIDRYFAFARDENGKFDPNGLEKVALQPMACVHCENAPCEQVCPVAATVHDDDGLNVMVYNRCIGTRYCSNNCPYKVRRFNYFDYHEREPSREQPGALLQVETDYYSTTQADPGPLKAMQFNPEVTVRTRGVMEKCTYCVQRIQSAKIKAKNDWVRRDADDPARADTRVPIADGTIKTACQQACPAGAIVFGDLLDSNSEVSKLHRHERAYEVLEELNVKPRTKYLAKIRNPINQEYASAAHHGSSEGNNH
jgi:molybdopterin-containing oxidoreductase family iron-sulfur binding subunit